MHPVCRPAPCAPGIGGGRRVRPRMPRRPVARSEATPAGTFFDIFWPPSSAHVMERFRGSLAAPTSWKVERWETSLRFRGTLIPVPGRPLATAAPNRCAVRGWTGRSFRGCEAAAPLKHSSPPRAVLPSRPFRGCEAAAPLKQGDPVRFVHPANAFRGCEAAAPLKPETDGLAVHDVPTFRGCEAAAPLKQWGIHGADAPASGAFRGCEAAAPLKPSSERSGTEHASATFRGCEAAAPLKRGPRPGGTRPGGAPIPRL